MEWLESLLPLLFLLIYFLAGVRRRKAKQQAPPAVDAEGKPVEKAPTPFEDLLQQIRNAAEQAQQEKAQTVAPKPPVVRTVPTAKEARIVEMERSSFDSSAQFAHDEHGFGAANPFSEEAFERQPQSPPPPPHKEGHMQYDPHEPLRVSSSKPRRAKVTHPLVKRLRAPGGLKEALILKEILDPPPSRR